jgi:hypothetical protein
MKLYIFRTVPLSIIRSFSLYTQQWYSWGGMVTHHVPKMCLRCRSVLQRTPQVKVQGSKAWRLGYIVHSSLMLHLSPIKMNNEKISHVTVATWWRIILMTLTLFLLKQTVYGRYNVVLHQ